VFFTHGKILARPGSFRIQFSDGSVAHDSWIIFSEQNLASEKRHSSRYGIVEISRRFAPRGKPLEVLLMVPRSHLGKLVTSIELEGGES
jgi:hypothetical protein